MRSTAVLCQVIKRLPPRLSNKWREHAYRLRRQEEPTLINFESWLHDRIMAARDPYANPSDKFYSHLTEVQDEDKEERVKAEPTPLSKGGNREESKENPPKGNLPLRAQRNPCLMCSSKEHHFSKCPQYLELSPGDRVKFIQTKSLCFNCLRSGHSYRTCNRQHCMEQGCVLKHHTTIHKHFVTCTVTSVGTASAKNKNVFCKVVEVAVRGPTGKEAKTFAFLDDGSDGTFVKDNFAKSLDLEGERTCISLSTIIDKEQVSGSRVSLQLRGTHKGAESHSIQGVITLPESKFKLRSQILPSRFHSGKYKQLQGLGLRDVDEKEITLLIGLDNFRLITIQEIREGLINQPVAAKTALGWTAYGAEWCMKFDPNFTSNKISLEEEVKKLWDTDFFGTEFKHKKPLSQLDNTLLKQMETTSSYNDGHMVVNMLWKGSFGTMPDSYATAEKRYYSLRNRLMRNPDLRKKYCSVIEDYIAKGYARKLDGFEISHKARSWILAHHPVVNPAKEKIRVVFDCAARVSGKCLNDFLHTGPDLTNKLVGILIRFRHYPVALVADIEAMFHQVKVGEDDANCLKFLWSDDICSQNPPQVYQMLVHVFGARDSPSCAAYALRQTAIDNKQGFEPEVIEAALNDFYVDDLLKSIQTTEEARNIARGLKMMLSTSGFNLTKFISNKPEALSDLKDEDLRKHNRNLLLEKGELERTLGIAWDIDADEFTFTSIPTDGTPLTKRGILQILSSVYDPLGFLAPFVIIAKILLQELWRRKCHWDESLNQVEEIQWYKWVKDLQHVSNFKIKRWHAEGNDVAKRELHVFVDASEKAFGAAAYVRTLYMSGGESCSLLISKGRVAPLKTLSIPRLELQAAVLGVRLSNMIKEEKAIHFDEIRYWTDSMITLSYLSNETTRFKVFVGNRVFEILEHSKLHQWGHVPGEINPADDMTRGLSVEDICGKSRWKVGPSFEDMRKYKTMKAPLLNQDDPEIKRVAVTTTEAVVELIEYFRKYSSWQRMIEVIGWMLRFTNNRIKSHSSKKQYTVQKGYLKVSERKEATQSLIRLVQADAFSDEISSIHATKEVPRDSNILSLRPYLDENGILRVGGRLRKAIIPMEAKHQIILPRQDPISRALVRYMHRLHIHEGPQSLHASIRQEYWILGVLPIIRGLIRRCLECRKRQAKPIIPIMADLPDTRLQIGCPVFFNCGVDLFGPILTKIRRGTQKRWGCIFTCMSTRSVHLEVVEGLDADSFINTLRRFINRRGNPCSIRSDCGSNFKGADAELKEALKQLNNSKVGEFAAQNNIHWQYNPPNAPHMGGAWERLVGTVKRPLKSIMKDRVLTDFQLITILTEIEMLVNSRPLTPVSDSIDDFEALTPNHFILGRASQNTPISVTADADICSRKRWKQVQLLASHFWSRWRREYLPSITKRPKWNLEQEDLKVGDLVTIVDKDVDRGKWPLARVATVFPGDDGRVRVVEVQTANGRYIRPVSKLCLLERY